MTRKNWALVISSLVRRRGGASLAELSTALGWQPNSVRAGISKLRATGMEITSYMHFKHGQTYVAPKPRRRWPGRAPS